MPRFSARSNRNLKSVHPDLQTLFRITVEDYDCSVICGHRDQVAQDQAYHAGLSQVQWPDSLHNKVPSLAADVVPWPLDWKDRESFYHFSGYVRGVAQCLFDSGKMKYRIRSGADWDGDKNLHDQTFMDLPHFELIGVEDETTDT
jgi:peptidoglycan L-alanyl-D-glutamate endopeptidase CwlK|tara:strand:+ start:1285 stop:1719 length:435 start_codon:yes stop_codon:yes gene_type:complete